MEARPQRPTPFDFRDPRKQAIHERLLRLVGPGPAAFWKDACAILGGENPPGLDSATHRTGQLFREIGRALRTVLRVAPTDPAPACAAKSADGRRDEIIAILAAWGVSALLALVGVSLCSGVTVHGAGHPYARPAVHAATGRWTIAASLPIPAVSAGSSLLDNGDVLLTGGEDVRYGRPTT